MRWWRRWRRWRRVRRVRRLALVAGFVLDVGVMRVVTLTDPAGGSWSWTGGGVTRGEQLDNLLGAAEAHLDVERAVREGLTDRDEALLLGWDNYPGSRP